MALMAAVAAVPTVVQTLSSIRNPKDAERFAANAAAFARAQAGDTAALTFLKYRSGRFGETQVPGYGTVGGWATDSAKADAYAKYTAAATRQAVGGTVEQLGEQANEALGTVGYQIVPKLETWHYVALGAVVLGVLWYATKGR